MGWVAVLPCGWVGENRYPALYNHDGLSLMGGV